MCNEDWTQIDEDWKTRMDLCTKDWAKINDDHTKSRKNRPCTRYSCLHVIVIEVGSNVIIDQWKLIFLPHQQVGKLCAYLKITGIQHYRKYCNLIG